MSCTDRARDAKFKEIMVRFPVDRYPELEELTRSIGLKTGPYIVSEICKILNELKRKQSDRRSMI